MNDFYKAQLCVSATTGSCAGGPGIRPSFITCLDGALGRVDSKQLMAVLAPMGLRRFATRSKLLRNLSNLGEVLTVARAQKTRLKPGLFGALGRIRTSDRPVRSRVLYPAELRVREGGYYREATL